MSGWEDSDEIKRLESEVERLTAVLVKVRDVSKEGWVWLGGVTTFAAITDIINEAIGDTK